MASRTNVIRHVIARVLFYPTLFWNVLLGRWLSVRNWWDPIDPQVILGARPFRRDVERLHREGVTAVVNTCQEYLGPIQEYQRYGIEQLHVPTTDFTPPKLEDVERAVEFVERHVHEGEVVYIHCKAGRARSATVALCWLIKYRGLTPEQGQVHLERHRPHVQRRLWEREVVRQFVHRLENPSEAAGTRGGD